MNIKIDLNVCRVCLKQPVSSVSKVSLFDEYELYLKFQEATTLTLHKDDGLSQIICNKCFTKLQIVCEFQKQAAKAEKHMRKFISQVQQQFTQSFSDNVKSDEIDLEVLNETESEFVSEKPYEITLLELPEHDERERERTFSALISVDGESEMYEEQLLDNIEETENAQMVDNITTIQDTEENLGEIGIDYSVDELIDEEQLQPPQEESPLKEDTEEMESETQIDYLDSNVENNDAESELIYEGVAEEFEDDKALIICEHRTPLDDQTTVGQNFDTTPKNEVTQSFSESSAPSTVAAITNQGRIDVSRNMCLQCNKSFSTKTNLMRHLITHDGKTKPFQCNQCGSAFTQNGSLKQHMYIHNNVKPFGCGLCSKEFTQAKSLKFHMRRHTGEKPFECFACSNDGFSVFFRQKDGLKRHMMVKHPQVPGTCPRVKHECEICSKVLFSKYSLKVHLKRHENGSGKDFGMQFQIPPDN